MIVTCRVPNSQVTLSGAAGMDKAPCQTGSTQARNTLQRGGHAALTISCITWACMMGTGVSSCTYEVSNLQLGVVTRWHRGDLGCFPHAPHLLATTTEGLCQVRPDHFGALPALGSGPGDPWLVIHPWVTPVHLSQLVFPQRSFPRKQQTDLLVRL